MYKKIAIGSEIERIINREMLLGVKLRRKSKNAQMVKSTILKASRKNEKVMMSLSFLTMWRVMKLETLEMSPAPIAISSQYDCIELCYIIATADTIVDGFF